MLHSILKTLLIHCFFLVCLVSCASETNGGDSQSQSSQQQNTQPNNASTQSKANVMPNPFPGNGEQLRQFAQDQVDLGPRVPGSDSHKRARDMFVSHFEQTLDTVFLQEFTADVYGESFQCWNVIGQIRPEATKRVVLCAHWDTRPMADHDPEHSRRNETFDGANDGASGVAALMGIAEHIKTLDVEFGIDLILFDAEDMGNAGDADMFCIGSTYYSNNLPTVKPVAGILLDLVGDPNAVFPLEGYSQQYAPGLQQLVWRVGQRVAPSRFVFEYYGAVQDDHVPLNEVGIPTIDIIDLQLVGHNDPAEHRKYWHTSHDTMDKVSASTLYDVANVVWQSLQLIDRNLKE